LTSPEFSKLLESLYSLQRKGIKLGLDHISRLLAFLDNPHHNLKIIHVAGTNGKGSTCAHIESILRANGHTVGLYTSPHLIRFNERIRINGRPITNQEIIDFMCYVKKEIKKINSTFFETTTAMALHHFHKNKVNFSIIETGLGGRLDATNVIQPYLTVMTPISMDHMEILGDSIEKIANEKAGIIKENTPMFTANQSKEVMGILKNRIVNKKSKLILAPAPSKIIIRPNGTVFELKNIKFKTPMLGVYQAENASLAISVVRYCNSLIKNETISKGLSKVYWPGRMQKITKNIYYDVAHNEDGIKVAIQTLKILFPDNNLYGFFCFKKDKNLNLVSSMISNKFKKIFVLSDENGLLLDTDDLFKNLKVFGIKSQPVQSIRNGMKLINALTDDKAITLIFGSHYIAKNIFEEFEIYFDSDKN